MATASYPNASDDSNNTNAFLPNWCSAREVGPVLPYCTKCCIHSMPSCSHSMQRCIPAAKVDGSHMVIRSQEVGLGLYRLPRLERFLGSSISDRRGIWAQLWVPDENSLFLEVRRGNGRPERECPLNVPLLFSACLRLPTNPSHCIPTALRLCASL